MVRALSEIGPYAGLGAVLALLALLVAYVRLRREVHALRPAIAPPRPAPVTRVGDPAISPRRRAGAAHVAVGAAALALLAAGVLALALGGGGDTRAPAASVRATSLTPAQQRARIRVMVLNAAGTQGLARRVSRRLTRQGFGRGRVTNAGTLLDRTEVAFLPGHRAHAGQVARVLGVGAARVGPAGATLRRRAGRSTVVVLVGSDQATGAPPA